MIIFICVALSEVAVSENKSAFAVFAFMALAVNRAYLLGRENTDKTKQNNLEAKNE